MVYLVSIRGSGGGKTMICYQANNGKIAFFQTISLINK